MSYKLCLRCGGDCASYASQCIHCHHSFKQPYVQNKNDNDKVVLLFTQWREGQSLEGIAASLNSAGIQPLNADMPWSPQSVAHAIHRFTTTGLEAAAMLALRAANNAAPR